MKTKKLKLYLFSQMNNLRDGAINKMLICENLFAKYLCFLVNFLNNGINTH